MRSIPAGRAQIASIWPVLRARSGDRILKHPAFVPVHDVAGLPRVLLLGDSISIGYTVPVRRCLKGCANVHRPLENCANTWKAIENLERWLGEGSWRVIVFNFGLHDAVTEEQKPVADLDQYSENLKKIVRRLKATGAELIWAATTPVPESAPVPLGDMPDLDPQKQREYPQEEIPKYNARAGVIMAENGIPILDLFGFALPKLSSLQAPGDIHFTKTGYAALGVQVAEAISQALGRP